METDNDTSFPLSVSVTLIHSRPLKKPALSPSQISTGTGNQISPGANRVSDLCSWIALPLLIPNRMLVFKKYFLSAPPY
jgi:hypothetical protein